MKEYQITNEAEMPPSFAVTSPLNQRALSSVLYLHMDNYSTIVNDNTPHDMLKKREVSFRVAQKLVGAYVNHHGEWQDFCPPDMYQWEVLGMPKGQDVDIPAYLEADGSHKFGTPRPEVAVFDDPEDVTLLYDVCHEYLMGATLHQLGGGHLNTQVMEDCVLPLRAMIDDLATAATIEVTDELKTSWGILPEHELNDQDQEILSRLERGHDPNEEL